MMANLNGKRILLITPEYFGYEKEIAGFLTSKGAKVRLIYDNLRHKYPVFRLINAISKNLCRCLTKKYLIGGIKKSGSSDYVLVIRGESLSEEELLFLKGNNPNANFIMYQWDSVRNNEKALIIADYFDKVLTFDLDDAEKYGWLYRPLFSADDSNGAKTTDVAYICSFHSKRISILKEVKKICAANNLVLFDYVFITVSHLIRLKYIEHNSELNSLAGYRLHTKALDKKQTNRVYACAKTVVDYTHPNQSGYTMRTIESICHRCKLVTNNKKIVDADFYNPSNVFVYDDSIADVPIGFFNEPYVELDESIYNRYSLKGWVEDLLR